MSIYGYCEGVVSSVEVSSQYVELNVLAVNGKTCKIRDDYGHCSKFAVGDSICIDEAPIMFDNGEIIYHIDEQGHCLEIW